MGLIKQGILGGFRKKTGAVVGAYWRSLDVIRALPRNSGKAPTQLQLDQQIKFGLVTAFLSDISELIDVGFKSVSNIATPMNKAVAYHLKEAISGSSPNFSINPSMLKYSVGRLKLPEVASAVEDIPSSLVFTWNGTDIEGKLIDPTDKVTFLVYNPTKKKFMTAVNIVARSVGEYEMAMPSNFSGDMLYPYISFSSVIKKGIVSDSLFLDPITLAL
jgi:hypothetical protein